MKHLILFMCGAMLLFCGVAYAQSGDVWRDATLYRDEWGVPHVYGDTPFALGFVFGWAQAEDHCEHMLLAYRLANGRLAAVLGEAYADSDAFSLKMGHGRLARDAFPSLDPLTQSVCEGFAMGVNAWLVEHADIMPAWADGVQAADVLALWHAFTMSLAPFDLPDTFHRAPAIPGGNAWVMSPERSPEQRTTLVMNPHQCHDGFFQWYEAHLSLGGLNVYGATLRGLPVLLMGHNGSLGWALTPNQANSADMFREEYETTIDRNPKDPRFRAEQAPQPDALLLHYMAHSLPYHVRTDAGLETRYVPAYIGDHGPLFEHAALGLHSWMIGGYRDFGGLRQLMEMGLARNLEEFTAALHLQQIPCFNIVYADGAGNIFYLYNTKAGIRMSDMSAEEQAQASLLGQRWEEPVSHRLAAIAWRDVFRPDNLPHILNPPSGFIQASGNPPWTATDPPVLMPGLWPDWLVRDADSYRAKRVRQLLRQGVRSFRDHQSMLYDMVVPVALDMLPALMRAIEARPELSRNAHPDFQEGLELLRRWNFIAETGSAGMTFFHLWWTFARTRSAAGFPSTQAFIDAALMDAPVAQEVMVRAVEDAARMLRNEYGVLEQPWGEVHRIIRGDRDEPAPGASSGEPIFTASDHVYRQGRWIATCGYGFAMVTQFGENVESVSVLPFGVSQRQTSPHYADQLDLMLGRRFKRVRFDHDDILRNAARATGKTVTLAPLGVPGAVTLHGLERIQVRLQSATEAPATLPLGFIPFSMYIGPETAAPAATTRVELSLHVPVELCDDIGFAQLQLYRYEPGLDWHPVAVQRSDAAARIIYGRDEIRAPWYAVLGHADIAGEERYRDIDARREMAGPVGLDALVRGHETRSAQRSPVSPGRSVRETEVWGDAPQTRQIFRFERHDMSAEEGERRTIEGTPVPPGVMFGPARRESEPEMPPQGGRKFHIERHDTPNGQPKLDDAEAVEESPSIIVDAPGVMFGPGRRRNR